MDQYIKMFKPAMVKWLLAHYPLEEARKRWKRTLALAEKWLQEEGDLGGKDNPMAKNMLEAYLFFAFYESVDRNFTNEDLQGLLGEAMEKSFKKASRFNLNTLLKFKLVRKLIYNYLEKYQKKSEKYIGKEWGNSWKIRLNPENHDKGLAFVFDTCPLNDFARKHGYLDFLPNLCYIDHATCGAAHGKLIRHKTLAAGDGECNYWILGDKDPDALADVGSK